MLANTIAARKRVFEEEERRQLQQTHTNCTAPTNPAGRPNQQRYGTMQSSAKKPAEGATRTENVATSSTVVSGIRVEQLQAPSTSDADIFGEFFEAPETAETINQPRGSGLLGGQGNQPVFAPAEVEAELDYFLNEPSPPARKSSAMADATRREMEPETDGLLDL